MKTLFKILAVYGVLLITIGLLYVAADNFHAQAVQVQKSPYLLKQLKVNDNILLTEKSDKYTITVMKEAGTHEIVEIGQDYLACKDAVGTQTLVPVYAIKCVVHIKTQ